MKALWALGEGTVHEIRFRLLAERPLAYTTVMTVMDRLARKGVVERQKRGRAHLYRALVAERLVCDHALQRLIENFFLGSRERLRQYLENGVAKWANPPGAMAAAAKTAGRSAPRAAPEGPIDPTLL